MSANRREFMAGAAAAGAAMACGLPVMADDRPRNLLFIIVDQMRSRCWFPPELRLPGIERLEREGISFTSHFTSAVPCTPSRACMLTGLHMTQHGIRHNVPAIPGLIPGGASLDPAIPTLGHVFRKAGYRTPYFGKWHLTRHAEYWKDGLTPYGFEAWHGPDGDGWPLQGLNNDPRYAHQAISWLKNNGRAGPWFLTCSLINPHDVMFYKRLDMPPALVPNVCDDLPENFHDDLAGKPAVQGQFRDGMGAALGVGPKQSERVFRNYLNFYYYLERRVDMQIQRILDCLDAEGLSDNTLVVFTSDHGEMAGSHGLSGKGPYVYNENNKVPLIMRWPGRIEPGVNSRAVTQSVDLFPTLADLMGVGIERGYLPGKSLEERVRAPGTTGSDDHALMCFGYSNADAFGPFTALLPLMGLRPPTAAMQVRAVYDGRYKFARYFDPGAREEFELYDLLDDPLEMRNLAGDPGYRNIEKEMAGRLRECEQEEMAPISPEVFKELGAARG